MRQGKELYTRKYQEAMELHEKGMNTKEIADKLGVSFSAVYSWTKKGKKPSTGIYEDFEKFLKENGPSPILEVKKKFPKHSETYLTAKDRGIPIKRMKLSRIMADYSIWYYLPGQEEELKRRVDKVISRRKELQEKFLEGADISKI